MCEVGSGQSCGQGSVGRGATPGLVGSKLRERWAGWWVTQRAGGSCHTLGEQPEEQERGCLCLAGCSQGAKQPWGLAMEFRPGESLQGSAVCSGSFVEQSKGCCHSRHSLDKRRRWGSPCASAQLPVQREAGEHWDNVGCKGQEGTMAWMALVRICRSSEKT